MDNPWTKITLDDYENHMSLGSVRQLQALNSLMKDQLEAYPVDTAVILGVAGGNGLEHVSRDKYRKVYGIDINEDYLRAAQERHKDISDILQLEKIDLINEPELLPGADLVIADLLVEYIGYGSFVRCLDTIRPDYVSCVIQINTDCEEWVSDSPYLHAFDGLDEVHTQMEETSLDECMRSAGFIRLSSVTEGLPNGKALQRIDYIRLQDRS